VSLHEVPPAIVAPARVSRLARPDDVERDAIRSKRRFVSIGCGQSTRGPGGRATSEILFTAPFSAEEHHRVISVRRDDPARKVVRRPPARPRFLERQVSLPWHQVDTASTPPAGALEEFVTRRSRRLRLARLREYREGSAPSSRSGGAGHRIAANTFLRQYCSVRLTPRLARALRRRARTKWIRADVYEPTA